MEIDARGYIIHLQRDKEWTWGAISDGSSIRNRPILYLVHTVCFPKLGAAMIVREVMIFRGGSLWSFPVRSTEQYSIETVTIQFQVLNIVASVSVLLLRRTWNYTQCSLNYGLSSDATFREGRISVHIRVNQGLVWRLLVVILIVWMSLTDQLRVTILTFHPPMARFELLK